MPPDTDDATQRLLACPIGCAFLMIVERDEVSVSEAVSPRHAFEIAATALNEFYPWSDETKNNLQTALLEGLRLRDLAEELVNNPGSSWWWEPLDRDSQVWLPSPAIHPAGSDEERLVIPTPSSPESSWLSPYGENFVGWQATSTVRDELAFWEVALAAGVGDWDPRWRPTRYGVQVSDEARIFEINGPVDWHTLCARYPMVNENPQSLSGPGVLVPDWSCVAHDWDGVHLTFGGLLTTPWVEVESNAGRSQLWSWDSEWTIWLRHNVLTVEENLGPTMADFLDASWRKRQGKGWSGDEWLNKQQLALPARVLTDEVKTILRARPAAAGGGGRPGGQQRLVITSAEGEVRFVTDEQGEWQLQDCIQVSDDLRRAVPRPDYAPLNLRDAVPELTTQFDPEDQMSPSTELRQRSFGDVQKQLQRKGKILITHRSRAEAVLLPYNLYRRVVRRLELLRALVSHGQEQDAAVRRRPSPSSAGKVAGWTNTDTVQPPPKEPPVMALNGAQTASSIARNWATDARVQQVRPEEPIQWPDPVRLFPGASLTLVPLENSVTPPVEGEVMIYAGVNEQGVPQREGAYQEHVERESGGLGGIVLTGGGWLVSIRPELKTGTYYFVTQLAWPNPVRHGSTSVGPLLMASYIFTLDVQ